MDHTEKILEFDKVKELWADCALTETAKETVRGARPILSQLELESQLRETTQAREMLERCGTPPLSAQEGIREMLSAAAKGQCLTAPELERAADALTAAGRLKSYLERGKSWEIPLAYYAENIEPLDFVREEIRSQIWNEQVADNASETLKRLRMDILRAEDKMREKADAVLRANKECMSDSFSTLRGGHVCIPVKKEYKCRISGTVIDKSATGSTLFMEPAASAKYYEELQALRIDEENEVRRILYTLTALVADCGETMEQNMRTTEKLDYIFSKGKLSMSLDGTEPVFSDVRQIRLKDARHPLMDRTVCVPLNFALGNGVKGIVITGPNTGGKTVALKTVALTCMMAQCGLHVPCGEALLCMNNCFLCDIGDGQNLSENLSTFSAHITNVLDILKKAGPDSLVVLDELGSGTDPAEGMGIAIAILEELKKSGTLFLATTHYPEVKAYAEKEDTIVNARMTFDKENLKPLYQMVIGEAGESCAFYIAGRLGMPPSMLRRAAMEAYGPDALKAYGPDAAEDLGDRFGNLRETELKKEHTPSLTRKKAVKAKREIPFRRGDSVMIYPDRKIGIVCEPANDKGALRVQLPSKKIWISHKRVKLLAAAEELYPENYDFSIVFDTVANRKLRHQMERKYVEGTITITD